MNGDLQGPARWVGRAAGAALLVTASGTLVVTVKVRAAGGSVPCGSGWDVVAGRSGWRQWWAQDLADPVAGAPLLRTNECVDAVNTHIVGSAALAVGAVLILAVTAVIGSRHRPPAARSAPMRRLHGLGTMVTLLGGMLTAAGLTGIALLTADPDASLFVYVSRPTAVLLGLLLLVPALLLVVLGRGLSLLADRSTAEGTTDGAP